MKTAHRVLLGLGLAALVFLASCSQPGSSSSTPPSNAQAQIITTNVLAAMQAALGASPASYKTSKGVGTQSNPAPGTYSFGPNNESGYTISGSYTWTGSYVSSATLTITFASYTYNNVTLNSGTATMALTGDASGDENLVYTGSFNITYQGTPYTFGWDLTYNYVASGTTITYSGYFTIDGQQYTYTG